MMQTNLRPSAAWSLCLWLAVCTPARPAPSSAEAFIARPGIERAVPSPSGKRLALVVATARGRNALAVMDLPPTTAAPRVVGGFADGDIGDVRWVNDDRLIFDAAQDGYQIAQDGTGTIAVNHDGSGSRRLISWRESNFDTGTRLVERLLNYEWSLLTTLSDGSADVIVVQRQFSAIGEVVGGSLARLDTQSGRSRPLAVGTPSGAGDWIFDCQGELRVARTASGGRDRLHVRQGDGPEWRAVSDQPLFSDLAMEPVFLEAGGQLVVRTGAGTDTQGLYTYDIRKQRLGPEPLARTARFDIGRGEKEALPADVLVHGSPWLRGASRVWDGEAQFLAAQGWRVIQPDFRGSTGYGERLFRAGWKQWGQAMQDDLADAVQWAVAQGLVDARHVCIVGASYGGYAALMGPIRHPDLYRCAASFAGVTDISLMFSSGRADFTRDSRLYVMPQLIGDPNTDAEMMRRNSPVERVAEIRVPVLMAQGTLDRRVPREHANRFEAAAKRAGVQIERIDYHDAGHGFANLAQHADFLNRLAIFLSRSLDH